MKEVNSLQDVLQAEPERVPVGHVGHFMGEQCGQCPPCRMQTNQVAHILEAVKASKGPGYSGKIEKITAFARGKGKCSLIEMAAAPVLSALRLFPEDFAARAGG